MSAANVQRHASRRLIHVRDVVDDGHDIIVLGGVELFCFRKVSLSHIPPKGSLKFDSPGIQCRNFCRSIEPQEFWGIRKFLS